MRIDIKPRTGRNETLFLFRFSSSSDFQVFIQILKNRIEMTSDPDLRRSLTQMILKMEKRCDEKYSNAGSKYSASIFADEMVEYLECLERICFAHEYEPNKTISVSSYHYEEDKEIQEYLKREAMYLEKIQYQMQQIQQMQQELERKQRNELSMKQALRDNPCVFLTERGQREPAYVIMTTEQFKQIQSRLY